MLKIYDDGSIYIGEMKLGQRNGKGSLYFLGDFFEGYKISGNWENDKLEGWAQVNTKAYMEEGCFESGIKQGAFFRYYTNGRYSAVTYRDGENLSEEIYSTDGRIQSNDFGCIKISDYAYYVGDICNNRPLGFGMIYNVNKRKQITSKSFCEIYGQNLVQYIDLDENNQQIDAGLSN